MLLRGNGQQAEDLILDLAEFRINDDIIADHLLYALALAQIHECNFEATIKTCKRLWQAIRRAETFTSLHGHDIWRLLAVSYRESGSELFARAMEEVYPEIGLYAPLPTVGQFIASCNDLLAELSGFDKGGFDLSQFNNRVQELASRSRATSLEERLIERSQVQADIATRTAETHDKFIRLLPQETMILVDDDDNDDTSNSGQASGRRHLLKKAASLFSRTGRASHSGSTVDKAFSIPRSQSLNMQKTTHKLRKVSSEGSNDNLDDKFKDATVAVLSSAALILTFPVSLPVFLYRHRRQRRAQTAADDHVRPIPEVVHEVDAPFMAPLVPEIKERRFSFEGFPATPDITPPVLSLGEPYWQQHLYDHAELPDFRLADVINTSARFEMEDTSMQLIERKLNEISEAEIPQRGGCVGNATTPNTVALTSSRSLEDMYGTNDHHVTEHPVSPHWDSGYESGSSISCKEGDSMCDSLGNGVLPFVQGELQPDPPDQAHQVYRPYRPYRPCRPSQLCVSEACRIEDVFRNHDPPDIPALPLWIEEKLKGTLTGNSEG